MNRWVASVVTESPVLMPPGPHCPGAARQTGTRLRPRLPLSSQAGAAPRTVTCALGYAACVRAAARVPVAFGCSAHGSGSGSSCGSDSDSAASYPCDPQTVSASESPDPFGGPRRACAGVDNQEAWRRGLSFAAARPGLPKLRLIPGSNLLPLPRTPGTT